MKEEITSRSNQYVHRARAVRDGRYRELVFVEGLRLSEEVLQAGAVIEQAFVTHEFAARDERNRALVESLAAANAELLYVADDVMNSLGDTSTPAGIIMLAQRPETNDTGVLLGDVNAMIVIAHRINNPANAGAILRTAEAAGVSGVVFTEGSADVFSPKALRGGMGSTFRVPLWTGKAYEEVLEWCSSVGVKTYASALDEGLAYTEVAWSDAFALILGPEAQGLTPKEIARADATVFIPMGGSVESLNVAVAAGIVMYEVRRQRNCE